jgi:MFS family permease
MAGAQIVVLELLAGNPSRATTWPLIALAGFTIVGWNGAYYALLAERAGPARVGRASGTMLVFIFAGSVVVPPVLGVLVDSLDSWRPLWAICGGVVALGAGVLWFGLRGIAPAAGLVVRSEATP